MVNRLEEILRSLKRRVEEILAGLKGEEKVRGRVLETWERSKRIAEEFRRELFGDTLFTETIITSLIVLSVLVLVADFLFPAGSVQARSIYNLDLLICAILALEFVYRLLRSRDKGAFLSHYWYEVLALTPAYATVAINAPVLAAFLRLFRLVRVYRVYKVLGRQNIYVWMLIDIIREARLLQLLVVFLVGLSFTSVIAFMAEARAPGSTIRTLTDAFWWSLATVTTVGYGDVVPVTPIGRAIGVILMLFGIAVLGGFISLTSTSVMSVLSRYQRVMREQALAEDYMKLRYLAARITELSEEEYHKMLELAERLRSSGPGREDGLEDS
ncbi:MAG: potassium channel family protein [Desulfurococcales archaeon]|nr:potassium channel family protein [Desulfurococcales archaeon]